MATHPSAPVGASRPDFRGLRRAEMQILAGKTEEGRQSLHIVERDAAERGFLLLSQKAASTENSLGR